MKSSQLVVEAPALRRAIVKLLGEQAVPTIAIDYERAAALGGNMEHGIVREQGVSYNPRIARVASIAIEDGGIRDLAGVRIAIWSTIADVGALKILDDAAIRDRAADVLSGEKSSDSLVNTIRAAAVLDTTRHLHMTTLGVEARRAYLCTDQYSDLLSDGMPIPSRLKLKLKHAVAMQKRLLAACREGAADA